MPRTGLGNVLETPDGYLWIGSAAGVLRFDGIRFTRFDAVTAPALVSSVPGITEPGLVDHAGTLWLTRPDMAIVTWRDGIFTVVVPPDTSRRTVHMSEDGRGRIWGVVAGGVLQVIDHGTLRPAPLPPNVPTRGLLGLVRDTGTGIWIGTRSAGLWHVTDHGAEEIRRQGKAVVDGIAPLLQSRDGALWAWGNGLEALRDGKWSRVALPGNSALIQAPMVAEGKDGSVWIATRGFGLLRWRNGEVEQFSKEDGLSETTLLSVAPGTRGVVWVSTVSGVDRLRPAPFTNLTRKDGLGFDAPLLLLPDTSGALWALAAGENAVYLIDGGIVRPGHGPLHATRLTIQNTKNVLPLDVSRSGGLWLYDSTKRVLHYDDGKVEVAGRMIVGGQVERPGRLVEDGDGHRWVSGITHGFGEFRDGAFISVPLPGVPGDPVVLAMVADSRGHVWLTTRDPATLQEIVGGVPQLRADSTRGLRVGLTVLAAGSGDTVWGRKAGMLARVINGHVATMSIPMVDTAMVGHSPMLALMPDALWVAGEGGIGTLSLGALNQLADGKVVPIVPRWFTPDDGVPSARLMTMSWQAGIVARDGRLWLATPGGLAVADPARLHPNPAPPAVHVEEVRVSGLLVAVQPALVLSPNPDRIEIRYTATGLLVPERARFEYRLDGADTGWVAGGPERFAAYTQLRAGRYRFHVRAWSDDGVPSTSDAALMFRVLPAWNQSWWFTALLLLLIIGTAGGSVHLFQRMRLRETENHLKMRFDATLAERSRLAGELHDTLLQGFTGVTLQLQAGVATLTDRHRPGRGRTFARPRPGRPLAA